MINEDSEAYIKTPEEVIFIPGSLEAIAALNRAGHQVVVATNQSGLARGLYSEATLKKIHAKLERALSEVGGKFSGIFYCPHHPDDHCNCRKPKPGLLLQIADQFQIDLKDALMVGDTERDIAAAQSVGCPAVLVKSGKGQEQVALVSKSFPSVPVFENLSAFVRSFCRGAPH